MSIPFDASVAIDLSRTLQQLDLSIHEAAFDDPDTYDEKDFRRLVEQYRDLAGFLPSLQAAAEMAKSNGLDLARLPEAIQRAEEAESIVRAYDRDRAESGEETADWLDDLRRDAVAQARNGEAVSFARFGR